MDFGRFLTGFLVLTGIGMLFITATLLAGPSVFGSTMMSLPTQAKPHMPALEMLLYH